MSEMRFVTFTDSDFFKYRINIYCIESYVLKLRNDEALLTINFIHSEEPLIFCGEDARDVCSLLDETIKMCG